MKDSFMTSDLSASERKLQCYIAERFNNEFSGIQSWICYGIPSKYITNLTNIFGAESSFICFKSNFLKNEWFEDLTIKIDTLSQGIVFWGKKSNLKLINVCKIKKIPFLILNRGWLEGLGINKKKNIDSWVLANDFIWTSRPVVVPKKKNP